MPNLATLMVGLGYDLSALEKGAPEAFRLINTQTAGMSAEMKRTSREGAESFRLIDEALGVHVSRPLTRILTQEFPGFAKGLQSIMGISIAGATGLVAFEGIARLLESGKKLLEVTGALEGWKQMLGLVGETAEEVAKEMTAADTVLIANLKHKIEMQDAYNQLVLGLKGGDFERAHLELMKQETAELQKQFTEQMLMIQARASEPGWRGLAQIGASAVSPVASGLLSVFGISQAKDEEVQQVAANKLAEAMKPLYEAIKKVNDEITKAQWKIFRDDADAATAAARADIAYLQGDLKRWNEAADSGWKNWMHINEELEKAIANLRDVSGLSESAQRFQKTGITTPVVAPVFGTGGGTANDQLAAFAKDTDAQQALIKQAFQSAITPAEQYALKVQELKLAFASLSPELKNTAATQAAFNAELAKLGASATQAELHLQELTKKLDEMLAHSTSARAGVQAFFLQLEVNSAQNGKFAFDLLNSGLKGFEDNLTKMVFDGKAKWKDLFRSLTEEAFKFLLNKDIAGFFQMVSGTGAGKSLGLGSLVPSLTGGGGAGGATLAAASTTLQSGSTLLLSAATTLQAAATTLSGGAAGGVANSGGFPSIESLIPGFASGTDDAPGGMAWVGEQGPELLNLPAGSQVTPSSSLRAGGGDQHFYIDAKGAEIGVEEKIVRALAAAKPRFIGEALANFSEVQKRTAGQR